MVALFTIALLSGRTRTDLLRRTAAHGAWSTNLRYLHGLCPCPAPSSASSPVDVRAADRVCCAVYTSPVPPAISSSSATKTIDIQISRSGILNAVNEDVTIFIESLINAKGTIRSRLARLIRLRRFTGFIRPRFLRAALDSTSSDRFPRKSIGNEGLLAMGMFDEWRVERLNSFLPPSRLNKTTFLSDGWKRHRRNYLSLLARTTSISLRGERRIIGRIVESCFFFYRIMHECREKYWHAFPNAKALEYPRRFINFFFVLSHLFNNRSYELKQNSFPKNLIN